MSPPPATAPEPAAAALPLLQQPGFRRFWLSRLSSTAAGQMLMVALGWQMYDLTGSAWDLGLVGLAQFVPALLLALPAGHVVDRYPRQRVLAAVLLAQAVVAALLALATAHGALGRSGVLALSVVLGAARAFQMPASQALLPLLVDLALLPRALALSSVALQGAIIAGPALGGALYATGGWLQAGHAATAGAAAVYAVSALGFAVALWAVWGLRPRRSTHPVEPPTLASLSAGLGFVWRHKVVLGAVSLDLFAVLLGGATALLPIFARDILATGPEGLGLLRAAPAAGALLMSLWLARRPIERHTGRWLLGSVAVFGVTMIVFGLSASFWLSLLALAVSGAADMVSVVIRQTLVQLETPDAMRGRVSAVNGLFIGASNQLGEFESGATAAWLGPVGSVLLGGVGTMLVVLTWTRLFPALARRDRLVRPASEH
ncbi:MFS transporter [Aquabacterium sp. OR-4]|uniref:MFS transporter n=1 Tax=Aquabacterium sp. OR-4 TaxID=2978127 RepID=UPI0028CA96C9|nr:MFS transporter [Aquabacterium sp. OR-4]MDT7836330.1 MFS transporter [Aquabacterium sp. OR-4]